MRCEPDSKGGPCKRCLKAGRKCEITPPSRKRQKKTDSRVSELEKQLADIQAQLKISGQTGGSDSGGEQYGEDDLTQFETPNRQNASQPFYPQQHYGKFATESDAPSPYMSSQTTGQKRLHSKMSHVGPREAHMYGPPSHNAQDPNSSLSHSSTLPEEDLLASVRKIANSMESELGMDLLREYLKTVLPQSLSLDTTVSTKFDLLRRSQPVLFVAIMMIMLQTRCKDGAKATGLSTKSEGLEKGNQALHVLSEVAMGKSGQVGGDKKGPSDDPEMHDPKILNPANAFIEKLRSVDEREMKNEKWFEEVLQGFQ